VSGSNTATVAFPPLDDVLEAAPLEPPLPLLLLLVLDDPQPTTNAATSPMLSSVRSLYLVTSSLRSSAACVG
jgi:hypothetical protein